MATQKTKHFKLDCLKDGLLIKDISCGDLGVLIKRHNILDASPIEEEIWVWDIFWTGSTTTEADRRTMFVEKSILTLLDMGAWRIQADYDA